MLYYHLRSVIDPLLILMTVYTVFVRLLENMILLATLLFKIGLS